MAPSYMPLQTRPMEKGVTIHRPDRVFTDIVSLDDPATVVMTDMRRITAVTIDANASLEAAGNRMKQRGVRLLLVVDDHDRVVGLITSTDLLGEKPLQHIQKHGGTRKDIHVSDVMTAQDQLEVLCMADVKNARVGHVVATLKKHGRQHALVVDRIDSTKPQIIRGIFSASQLARQLDTEIQTAEIVETFAEIEALLMGSAGR